jgi:methionine sulfoxide reductase heme-binding subunit
MADIVNQVVSDTPDVVSPAAPLAPPKAPAKPVRRGPPNPWLKPGVFAGCCVPTFYLGYAAALGRLGANPISTALNQFGLVGLAILIASLACTPLRIAFNWKWPLQLRKMLGLFGFYYICLHFLTYAGLDQLFDLSTIFEDITERPFIIVGFTAFLLLIPLAVTSTPSMAKRLGKNWQRLHRLAYVIVPLGVIHFIMRMKSDITQPLVYGAVVAALLGARGFESWRKRRARV